MTPLETLREARAKAIWEAAFPHIEWQNTSGEARAECTKAIRAIEAADAEMGMVIVPKKDMENLRAFASNVMSGYPESSPDGCDLHDIAVMHGVLIPHEVSEPCGENCACEEYDDFPQTCYRLAPMIAANPYREADNG